MPTTPLSPTTRPLNVTKSFSPLFNFKASLVVPSSQSGERSATPKSTQRRKSGSPAIGPSPLRNPIEASISGSQSSECLLGSGAYGDSSSALEAANWELSDLVKNGRLDVDAVSEALGLGFGLEGTESPNLSSTSETRMDSLVRRPGGPLYAIPEESDAEESIAERDNRPLSSVIERWGRVQRTQHLKRDANGNEIRESVSSSILEVDLSLLGIDVSAISGDEVPVPLSDKRGSAVNLSEAWEEDVSAVWRDESNARWVDRTWCHPTSANLTIFFCQWQHRDSVLDE